MLFPAPDAPGTSHVASWICRQAAWRLTIPRSSSARGSSALTTFQSSQRTFVAAHSYGASARSPETASVTRSLGSATPARTTITGSSGLSDDEAQPRQPVPVDLPRHGREDRPGGPGIVEVEPDADPDA